MNKTKNLVLAAESLPDPGETAELLVDDYEILITNKRDPNQMREGDVVTYSPVVVKRGGSMSATVHAAAVRKARTRTRIGKHPLCNRDRETLVVARAKGEEVTCTRCRGHLVSAGFLTE